MGYRRCGGVVVAQIGAREHYSIPIMLEMRQLLDVLCTDMWCSRAALVHAIGDIIGSMGLKSLAGRHTTRLPGGKVKPRWLPGVRNWISLARAGRDIARTYDQHLRFGREFSTWSARFCNEQSSAYIGFSSGALEGLRAAKRYGMLAITDQTGPGLTEEIIVRQERRRWPGWEMDDKDIPSAYFDRLEQEWDEADSIIVNSGWSRAALIQQGVAPEKIHVVPLAFEKSEAAQKLTPARRPPQGRMTVLWLGTVNLRKGFPYAVEAARILEKHPVDFVFAGPSTISLDRVKLPSNVRILGRVPRIETQRHYQQSHLFILPTMSDGFALTQLEAMAAGLPVIATRHCGEVVEDGISGVLVPEADGKSMADVILRFLDGELDLEAFSSNALRRVEDFSLERVSHILAKVVHS